MHGILGTVAEKSVQDAKTVTSTDVTHNMILTARQ